MHTEFQLPRLTASGRFMVVKARVMAKADQKLGLSCAKLRLSLPGQLARLDQLV